MGKFDLNKSDEEPKQAASNKFNLNKQDEPKQAASNKFNLNKQDEPKQAASNKFNLNKQDETTAEKPQKVDQQNKKGGAATQPQNKQETKRKSSKWWFWLLLIAIIVIAIIMLVKNNGSNNTDDTDMISTVPATEESAVSSSDESVPDEMAEEIAAPTEETEDIAETSAGKQISTPAPQQAPISSIPQGSLEQKAKQVIRGDFGNGQERKDRLGAEYAEIQAKVNEIMLH